MGVVSCGTTMLDQGVFNNIGAVTWDTTAKTSGFTAVSGNGYFVNTTSASITVTLPSSPSAGDIVGIKDYANTADTNKIVIGRNGSNIQGTADDFDIVNEGGSVLLVYVDGTQGWKVTSGSQANDITNAEFIVATGGTSTTCGDYRTHVFTGPGTFTVSSVGNPIGSDTVEYLVVAGGGAGASDRGAGGGAGGLRQNFPSNPCAGLPVSATSYPITVGGGGANGPPTGVGSSGSNSVFSTITSAGGGRGGTSDASAASSGANGGSGGGGADPTGSGGTGNTPPVTPPQGTNGGNGSGSIPNSSGGGGGGGASCAGANATPSTGGDGGNGTTVPLVPASYGSPGKTFAGGGGGGRDGRTAGTGGSGGLGGGSDGFSNNNPAIRTTDGVANTGGGSGGAGLDPPSCGGAGSGGSGIVIIRYKYQ